MNNINNLVYRETMKRLSDSSEYNIVMGKLSKDFYTQLYKNINNSEYYNNTGSVSISDDNSSVSSYEQNDDDIDFYSKKHY